MVIPNKLQPGDEIRIIAPARSMGILSDELKNIANRRLSDLGYKVTFGKNIDEMDDFKSSSVKSRVADLHDAFYDKNVKGILTVIGGFNSNQMLDYIDWELVKNNPKVFCGYSDITIFNNAFYAKTGLVSYSGPHYSTFGQKLYLDYTLDYFKKCCVDSEPFDVKASSEWSDDPWYKNQDNRKLEKNKEFLVINEGKAKGTIIGANLCTFNLLQGTQYMPSLVGSILFIEDDAHGDGSDVLEFDRNLQSLIQLPDFKDVKGIVIGRFQKAANMTNDLLIKIIKTKKELDNIPVIAGVDFGHTDPKITLPIGGEATLNTNGESLLRIVEH
jgi:muramoyltetrapeptide carboxypeptidase LdcA involved in peptidoglycan recycling